MNDFIKKSLRQDLLLRRQSFKTSEQIRAQEIINKNFLTLIKRIEHVQCIALYAAFPQEIQTEFIDRYLRSLNKKILYPRIEPVHNHLSFHVIHDDKDWEIGSFNISQPKKICQQAWSDIYVVPLLGFNQDGFRIGYGKGHYDRYFDHLHKANIKFQTIGLAYAWQQTDQFFQESFDYPLNYIITDQGILSFIS